jgi:hypothetical protein
MLACVRRTRRFRLPRPRCHPRASRHQLDRQLQRTQRRLRRRRLRPHPGCRSRQHHQWLRRTEHDQRSGRLLRRAPASLPPHGHAQPRHPGRPRAGTPHLRQRRVRAFPQDGGHRRRRQRHHHPGQRRVRNRAANRRSSLQPQTGVHGLPRRPGEQADPGLLGAPHPSGQRPNCTRGGDRCRRPHAGCSTKGMRSARAGAGQVGTERQGARAH